MFCSLSAGDELAVQDATTSEMDISSYCHPHTTVAQHEYTEGETDAAEMLAAFNQQKPLTEQSCSADNVSQSSDSSSMPPASLSSVVLKKLKDLHLCNNKKDAENVILQEKLQQSENMKLKYEQVLLKWLTVDQAQCLVSCKSISVQGCGLNTDLQHLSP